jgi:hypothetical protein
MSDHSNEYSPYGAAGYQNAGQGQYAQAQYAQQPTRTAAAAPAPGAGLAAWFNVTDPAYVKGLLLGAGAALVLTNPAVQKALVGGAVRVWAAVQGGIEEIKEQIEDVKAELSREG